VPAEGEKPYGAWEKVRKDETGRANVVQLLSCLALGEGQLPSGTLLWNDEDELQKAVSDHQNAVSG
jgi:putative ATP-dependent endonuclease of OLD family